MKIGFDAKRAAQNRTGLGNYSRFVVRILSQQHPKNEYHLYAPNPRRTPFYGEIPTIGQLRSHFPEDGLWRRLRSLWRVWGVTADLQRDGIQLFHGLSNELPLNISRGRCRSIVTIHDLIFIHTPQYYHWIDRQIYNYKFRRACQKADRVIAVSEYTKREIMHYYGVAEEKIDVVYQGCDTVFAQPIAAERLAEVKACYRLPDEYALFVGSIEERKNLLLLVEALRRAKRKFHIVAVGRSTAYCDRVKALAQEWGIADYCHFHHNVPFADLPSVYRLARVFVYPSRIEGFGIPLLEALNSGVPVIGCTGSCLEEAGGEGSIYVGPDDADGMADAVERVLSDDSLRQRMIADGREYAKRFSDERLCEELMAVYKKVLK